MHIFAQFERETISVLFALILALIFYFFRARAKLVWATPHTFIFLIQGVPAATPAQQGQPQTPTVVQPASNIQTASLIVQNSGRVPATDVEVTFNWQPHTYNIWPVRPYDTHISPDNRFTLKFANLAPKEFFQIELISPGNLPQVMGVRCRECTGKQIGMRPMVIYPKWFNVMVLCAALLGVAAIIYLVIKIGALFIAV